MYLSENTMSTISKKLKSEGIYQPFFLKKKRIQHQIENMQTHIFTLLQPINKAESSLDSTQ
jgi:hypothetical protein